MPKARRRPAKRVGRRDVGGDQVVNVDKLTYAGSLTSVAEVSDSPDYIFVQADVPDRAAIKAVLGSRARGPG